VPSPPIQVRCLLVSKKSSQLEASKTSGLSPMITASRVYFSILQAADYTTATPSWIEEQLRNGKLPYRWIGNKRVIFRRDLDELMESLPVETGLCDVPAFVEKAQKGKAAA
jgi:excisionase family DNA binding protein